MEKKYELTDEMCVTDDYYGIVLHRIRALRDFADVHAGDLGGWVESEKNLSHEGDAWVSDDAEVFGDAEVYGDATVGDRASVFGGAKVRDDAPIGDDAHVNGGRIFGNAHVSDHAHISKAYVYDNARVHGHAHVDAATCIHDNAQVYGWAYDSVRDSIRDRIHDLELDMRHHPEKGVTQAMIQELEQVLRNRPHKVSSTRVADTHRDRASHH